MHVFYTPDIDPNISLYCFTEEESKHCIRVLRLGVNDKLQLIDGEGGFYTAIIREANPKKTVVQLTEIQQEYHKRNHYLHIAIAPTKNIERLEWFLEKATEIGIDKITPLICDRSERKELKPDRLTKVITAAVKQSLKAYHPILAPAKRYSTFIKEARENQKFIAHCIEGDKLTLKNSITFNKDYLILIGPEGDFTAHEVSEAVTLGFKPITLGQSRLRTETAALEACFEINFLNR